MLCFFCYEDLGSDFGKVEWFRKYSLLSCVVFVDRVLGICLRILKMEQGDGV